MTVIYGEYDVVVIAKTQTTVARRGYDTDDCCASWLRHRRLLRINSRFLSVFVLIVSSSVISGVILGDGVFLFSPHVTNDISDIFNLKTIIIKYVCICIFTD